ncbi:MAG: hypothetical protein KDB27_34035 [Planctomycetales bacterium]|nr:hypothetical protein [Planctomycetales bacterium]
MQRARDQLGEEVTFPHLAAFLQSGGTLEVGEDFSVGAFARIRKGNCTVVVDATYRDFTAILKEMDSKARDWDSIPYEHGHQGANE